MTLTKATDGAARILILLAKEDSRLNGREISRFLEIPFNHVTKILQSLAKSGLVRTFKGNGGGVEIAIPPQTIRLDRVVEAMEGPLHLMECTLNPEACPRAADCRLSAVFKTAQEEMMKILRSTSISELIRNGNPEACDPKNAAASQDRFVRRKAII